MSEVIVGLLGVVAGAAATTGTQATLAWLHRRNESRTASRLLFGDLREARDILAKALQAGEWKTRRDLAHVMTAWRERREAIARATRSKDFHDVAGAFNALDFIQLVRERNQSLPDQGFSVARPRMPDAIERCDRARLVLAKTGCSAWERYVTPRPDIVSVTQMEVAAGEPPEGEQAGGRD